MSRVLIVHLPYASKNWYLGNCAEVPSRVAYIGAILSKSNIDYDVLDLNIESISKFGFREHNSKLKLIDPFTKNYKINRYLKNKEITNYWNWLNASVLDKSHDFDFILLNGDNIHLVVNILKHLKYKNKTIKVVLGGRLVSESPWIYVREDVVDFVCRGYAEEIIPKIVSGDYSSFDLIPHGGKNKIYLTNYGLKVEKILFPDYSNIKLKKYFELFDHVGMITNFGCAGRCKYCVYRGEGLPKTRPVDDIISEMKFFIAEHNIRNFAFIDNCINLNKVIFMRLCEKIISEDLKIQWGGFFRALNFNENEIATIKKAGCVYATFGFETANERLQTVTGKDLDLHASKKIIEGFTEAGILTRVTLMYDFPTESFRDFIDTCIFALRTNVYSFNFFKFYLDYPSEFYKNAHDYFEPVYNVFGHPERMKTFREGLVTFLKSIIAEALSLSCKWKGSRKKQTDAFVYGRRN